MDFQQTLKNTGIWTIFTLPGIGRRTGWQEAQIGIMKILIRLSIIAHFKALALALPLQQKTLTLKHIRAPIDTNGVST